MTDRTVQGDAWDLVRTLPAGTIMCLRDYGLSGRPAYAARLANACRDIGVRLLVAADVSLALRVGAWGVHIPEGLWKGSMRDVTLARGANLKVSTAIHSRQAAQSVFVGGQAMCDMATVSPAFPTRSHPDAKALGPLKLSTILEAVPVPAYALGGVTPRTISRLAGLPLHGIAGIRFS